MRRRRRRMHRILLGNPESRRLVGRQRRRWEDKLKIDLREM
jgi:hypothetical protein